LSSGLKKEGPNKNRLGEKKGRMPHIQNKGGGGNYANSEKRRGGAVIFEKGRGARHYWRGGINLSDSKQKKKKKTKRLKKGML